MRPLGAVAEAPVNVRIVSATHKDLGAEVQAGRFRQDLYYRLNVIRICVPPLRERIDDLPAICAAVLERIAARCRRLAAAGADARRAAAPAALCLSRQCARAGEPAAPRAGAGGRRRDRPRRPGPARRGAARGAAGSSPNRRRWRRAGPAARQRRRRRRPCPPTWRPISTTWNATSWSVRWSATATTAPPPAPAWACRCARCATAWRAWAWARPRARPSAASRPERMAARPRWQGGWWRPARRCPSPNFGPRPAGAAVTLVVVHSISLPPGEYGGDEVERLFTNRLDCAAHPYYAGLRGLEVSAHFFVRRDGAHAAVRELRRARLARRGVELARARQLQRLVDRHRTRRPGGRSASSLRSTGSWPCCCARWPAATRSPRSWATSTWRRGAKRDPGRASTGRVAPRPAPAAGRGCRWPGPAQPEFTRRSGAFRALSRGWRGRAAAAVPRGVRPGTAVGMPEPGIGPPQ